MLMAFRYFQEVARTGSIRRASEALNVAPSSISRQVQMLEQQFGTALLVRSAQGVALTHAGRMVEDFSRTLLLDYETLRADLDDIRGQGRAMIRVAAIESVVAGPPLAILHGFRDRFPAVVFKILTMTAPRVEEAVRAGSCDLGLTLSPAPDPDLRIVCDVREPLVLAVAPGHALAARERIAMADLRSHAIAVHESEHGLRRMIDLAARAHGFAIDPILSSSSLEVLRSFARRGLGGAVITRGGGGDAVARGQLVLVPIDEPLLEGGRIALVVRSNRRLSRALRLFVDDLAEALRDHAAAPA